MVAWSAIRDVARQGRRIGQDDVVAQNAVMRDVAVGHHKVVVSNESTPSALGGSSMYGDIFTKNIVVTHDKLGAFAAVFQVLRWKPDRTKREETAALADPCGALNDHMFVHAATSAQHDVITNYGIGANTHILSQGSFGADNCSGMNAHYYPRSTMVEKISASATSLSLTNASPLSFPCRARILMASTTMRI